MAITQPKKVKFLIDWHLYNGSRKIDDVLLKHGELLHVLPVAVHLRFFCQTCRGDYSEPFLLFEFYFGASPSCLKVMVGGWRLGGLQHFSVSPRPLGFGFGK